MCLVNSGIVEGSGSFSARNFSLSENFLSARIFSWKNVGRKEIFTLKFRKSGWSKLYLNEFLSAVYFYTHAL